LLCGADDRGSGGGAGDFGADGKAGLDLCAGVVVSGDQQRRVGCVAEGPPLFGSIASTTSSRPPADYPDDADSPPGSDHYPVCPKNRANSSRDRFSPSAVRVTDFALPTGS